MKNIFKEHPNKDHNTTYIGHMKIAFTFSWIFFKVTIAALCHGIFPWLFKTYASDTVKETYNKLTK